MPDQGRPGSLAHRLSASTRILAVEDEADIAEFLRAYFRASGYDLIHLDPSSPDEVVDAIDTNKPDLVLLDYRLRGFSGRDVYRMIRDIERFAFTPVIIVTGDASARAMTAETASGLDGFVDKPFNVNTLGELVAERIDAARLVAKDGRDDVLGVMTQAYLTARLNDEINTGGAANPVSFALVQLGSRSAVQSAAGSQGVTYVLRELIAIVREFLPDEAVLGRTDSDELAVVQSGVPAAAFEPALAGALAAIPATIALPGGATVNVEVAGGLASYPEHASSVDELYMAADAALADAVDAHSALCVAI